MLNVKMASFFQSGSFGVQVTSWFCSTPRLMVETTNLEA